MEHMKGLCETCSPWIRWLICFHVIVVLKCLFKVQNVPIVSNYGMTFELLLLINLFLIVVPIPEVIAAAYMREDGICELFQISRLIVCQR